MGVDYYVCVHCGESFPDCGYYVHCEGYIKGVGYCDSVWCSVECAEADGAIYDSHSDYAPSSCKYCRKEDVMNDQLIEFMLKYFNLSREDMVKEYYKDK